MFNSWKQILFFPLIPIMQNLLSSVKITDFQNSGGLEMGYFENCISFLDSILRYTASLWPRSSYTRLFNNRIVEYEKVLEKRFPPPAALFEKSILGYSAP